MEFSNRYILLFSLVLCVVCALAVSSVAVGLHDKQEANKTLDRRVNLLVVAGLLEAGGDHDGATVNGFFEDGRVTYVVFDRTTGAEVDAQATVGTTAELFNPFDWAKKNVKDEALVTSVPDEFKNTQVRLLPRYLQAVKVRTAEVECFVLPIQGYGLWSTLKGFLAVSSDLSSVVGITYYEHGETPGLGGEVDNPTWKGQFPGKQVYGASGAPVLTVTKAGQVTEPSYQINGMAGATITSKGVDLMLHFWLSDHGYGPYLKQQRTGA